MKGIKTYKLPAEKYIQDLTDPGIEPCVRLRCVDSDIKASSVEKEVYGDTQGCSQLRM